MKPNINYKIIFLAIGLAILVGFLGFRTMNRLAQETPPPSTSLGISELEKKPEEARVVALETSDFLDYDIIFGDRKAPVEIIEYAAISCSHCAHFHQDILPVIKEKYLDTGKARLVYRNFIFENPFDVLASSLTRCVAEEDFPAVIETFFTHQKDWADYTELKRIFDEHGHEQAMDFARDNVARTGALTGISKEQAKQCFANKAVTAYLLDIRKTAMERYAVNSTPTLIIAGHKLESYDLATVEKAIDEALEIAIEEAIEVNSH